MKKIILKLLLAFTFLFTHHIHAQASFTGLKKNYTQSMDSLLTFVNKTPVTTGILYDRIMPIANLSDLKENGIVTSSNYEHFIQSWSELYKSSYSPTFIKSNELKTKLDTNPSSRIVDFGIINTNINYLDSGTPTSPKLTFSGGYFRNVADVNPFLEKQVTIVAALKQKITAGSITFRLQPSLILQLSGRKIKILNVNFGFRNSYRLITNFNLSYSMPTIGFNTPGIQELRFGITYEDDTSELVRASIEIVPPCISCTSTSKISAYSPIEDFVGSLGIDASSPENTIPFKGYNEPVATKGTLEYRTYYNTITNTSGNGKITKPVIILDGYDPGDGRKIHNKSIGYIPDKSSLYELMFYDDDNNITTEPVSLVEKLRPLGFDVTLVNFPNGADYIERNAMALVALIKRENAKLLANGSTEKLTIIGPSMAGLISRYALAYMEKNNIQHNTKLWVSFDSPHLGANIPIAAQENLYFYGYFGDKEKARLKFDENFRSPAARQMLIEQLDGKHEAYPYPTNLFFIPSLGQNNNTPFRQLFQTNLTSNGLIGSNGFPQNLRKIALINGTINGTKTNGEGQMFLELAAFKYKIKVATIEDNFLSSSNVFSQTFAGRVWIY